MLTKCMSCNVEPLISVFSISDNQFGYELKDSLCYICHAKSELDAAREALKLAKWRLALDVGDAKPKAGHVFLVEEDTHSEVMHWVRAFESLRAATVFYRYIRREAGDSRLDPEQGIEEVTLEHAQRRLAHMRKIWTRDFLDEIRDALSVKEST